MRKTEKKLTVPNNSLKREACQDQAVKADLKRARPNVGNIRDDSENRPYLRLLLKFHQTLSYCRCDCTKPPLPICSLHALRTKDSSPTTIWCKKIKIREQMKNNFLFRSLSASPVYVKQMLFVSKMCLCQMSVSNVLVFRSERFAQSYNR